MNRENRLLLVLAAIQFAHIVDFMIMMPLGPQIMRLFDSTPQQFALLVSAYTFTAGIVSIVSALFLDRFDRKSVLMICFAGFTLGTLACAFATSYAVFLFTRALTGAFGGILGALVLSILGDAIPLERRATAMGKIMAAFSFASVVGVPLGLFVANRWTWHAPFVGLALFSVVVGVFAFLWIPRMRAHLSSAHSKPSVFEAFRGVLHNRNQQFALLLMIFLMFGQFTIVPFISPYMVANVGFTEDQLTYIYLIGGACTIVTSPLIGKLADRFGRLKVFTVSVWVSLIPLVLITHLGVTPVALVLVITAFFFILIGGRMIPAMTMITSAVDASHRGSFMSINSAVQQISSGSASFLAGLIVTRNAAGELEHYHYVGYIALAFSLLTLLVAWRIRPVQPS